MMYYFHSGLLTMWFTLYIEEKDQNKTEVGEAKTPLEITRLVHPVFSEELFMNEFFLCKNRKEKLKKMSQKQPFECAVHITLHWKIHQKTPVFHFNKFAGLQALECLL